MSNDHLRALAARDEAWLHMWNAHTALQLGIARVDMESLAKAYEQASDRVLELEMQEIYSRAA